MKLLLSILYYYVPWLAYSYLLSKGFLLAILCYIGIAVILNFNQLKQLFVIPITNLVGFLIMVVLSIFQTNISMHPWLISSSMIFMVTLGSIVIKKPFSIQYAKIDVEPTKWSHPIFLKINFYISIAWIIYFGIVVVLNILSIVLDKSFASISALLLLPFIIFTTKFPNFYRNRSRLNEQ
jgi:hypothetical protein